MKKDIAELKRRITKDDVSFTKVSACYVNSDKKIVTKFTKTFLTMDDEELYKYMEIAKKTLSGKYGNSILNLPINDETKKQSLLALSTSGLENENITDAFYNQIIDNLDFTGNYIIFLFHDVYDIITKTKDKQKLDESEEVYEYILCSICPVALSTPGLSYFENNNEISARVRDWVVGNPETGFVYPAFENRSVDRDSLLLYNKKPKTPHMELAQSGLGCKHQMTSIQKKERFEQIIQESLGDYSDNPISYKVFMEHLTEEIDRVEERQEPSIITGSSIEYLFRDSDLSENDIMILRDEFNNSFDHDTVELNEIINKKEIEKELQTISALTILCDAKNELERLNGNKGLIDQINAVLNE